MTYRPSESQSDMKKKELSLSPEGDAILHEAGRTSARATRDRALSTFILGVCLIVDSEIDED